MTRMMMVPLAIVLGAGAPAAVGQQTVTQWTGAINDLWTESGNWTAGVPNNGSGTFAAIIDTGLGFVQLNTNVTIDRALIGPTSAVRINNGRILDIVAEPDPLNPSGMTGILAIDNLLTIDTFNVATRIRMVGEGQLLITPGSTPTGRIETSNSTVSRIEGTGTGTQTIVFSPGLTFTGAGNVGNNTVRVDNRGVIEASLPAGLTLDAGDGNLAFNSGVLSAIDSSTLRLLGTDLDNTLGIIEASDTAGVRIEGSSSVLGGVLRTFDNGQILPQSGAAFDGVTIAPGSTVNQNNGVSADLFNDLLNDGTWTMNVFNSAVQLFTNGDFTIAGDGEIVMNNSTSNFIRPRASGEIITHAASHTIRGSGTLLNNVGGMVNNGAILAGPGSQPIVIDPQGDMDFVNNPGGVLGGTGTLELRDGTLDNRGTISPGFSPGTLTINATNVDNASSAVLRAELAGTDPGDGFDVLDVTGTYNAGGEIVVLLIDPFEPSPADSFEIVTAGVVAGVFANTDPGGDDVASGVISGNAEFDVVYGPDTVTLTNVRPAPEPCSPADVSSGARPGIPDGQLDANDFFFYLDRFAAGDLIADFTGSSGVPDGVLDANDFFVYLSIFADGCP